MSVLAGSVVMKWVILYQLEVVSAFVRYVALTGSRARLCQCLGTSVDKSEPERGGALAPASPH